MFFTKEQATRLRPTPSVKASSRLLASAFPRSLQRRLQVHRQQARPDPHFRDLFPFISHAGRPKMLLAVPEPAFDPIPFFLFPAKPRISHRRLHLSSQRFERQPHAKRFQVRPILPRPIFVGWAGTVRIIKILFL